MSPEVVDLWHRVRGCANPDQKNIEASQQRRSRELLAQGHQGCTEQQRGAAGSGLPALLAASGRRVRNGAVIVVRGERAGLRAVAIEAVCVQSKEPLHDPFPFHDPFPDPSLCHLISHSEPNELST